MSSLFRRSLFLLLWAFLAGPALAQSLSFKALLNTTYEKNFPLVYPEQKDILEDAVVLDTREEEEFSVSHLETARWVGYETFSMHSVSDIPKDKTIVVYCSIGARSQDIGKKLKAGGFRNVYNLYGGIFHWVNEGNPVFTSNSEQTERVHAFSKIWGLWLESGEKVY